MLQPVGCPRLQPTQHTMQLHGSPMVKPVPQQLHTQALLLFLGSSASAVPKMFMGLWAWSVSIRVVLQVGRTLGCVVVLCCQLACRDASGFTHGSELTLSALVAAAVGCASTSALVWFSAVSAVVTVMTREEMWVRGEECSKKR
jgi:hypothetical protein